MDKETLKYMKDKVTRFEQLDSFKNALDDIQVALINDEDMRISVGYDGAENDIGDYEVNKVPFSHIKDEYLDLLREVKDNLIDSIGMTIVKINQIMEEV